MKSRIEKWLKRSAMVVVLASVGCASPSADLESSEGGGAEVDLPSTFTAQASTATRDATGIEVWRIERFHDADMRIAGLGERSELVVAWQATTIEGKHHYELRTATTSASLAVALDGNDDEKVTFFENTFRGNEEAVAMLGFLRADMAAARIEPSSRPAPRTDTSSLSPQSPQGGDLINDPDSQGLVDPQCESLVREECSDEWSRYVNASTIADYECIDCTSYSSRLMPIFCSDCADALKNQTSRQDSVKTCKRQTNNNCRNPNAGSGYMPPLFG